MRTERRGMHGWVELPEIKRTQTTKRLKHTYDNPAHVAFHPLEKDGSGFANTSAWNPIKNFFFEQASDGTRVVYSYRKSYPIASRFEHNGKAVYLLRAGKAYSTTTAQHMSATRAAVPKTRGTVVFTVPTMTSYWSETKPERRDHDTNVAYYVREIQGYIESLKYLRSSYRIHSMVNEMRETVAELKRYCKFFHVRMPKLPALPKLDPSKMRKIMARERVAEEKRVAKRKAEREAWEAAHQAEVNAWLASDKACKHLGQDGKPLHSFSYRWTCERQQEQEEWEANKAQLVERWKAGEDVRLKFAYSEPVILRVKDGEVQTSHHAEVAILGLAGAARLWRFLKALKDAGRTYQRNGHSERIGHYAVESFNGDVLHIGCHRIAWIECERIAPEVLAYEAERGDVQQEEVPQ